MVDDISALGMRHVRYVILTDLPGPLALVCVVFVQGLTEDEKAVDGFQWWLDLVSHILTRANLEGSTLLVKVIDGDGMTRPIGPS